MIECTTLNCIVKYICLDKSLKRSPTHRQIFSSFGAKRQWWYYEVVKLVVYNKVYSPIFFFHAKSRAQIRFKDLFYGNEFCVLLLLLPKDLPNEKKSQRIPIY